VEKTVAKLDENYGRKAHTRRPVKQQSAMWTDFVETHVAKQQHGLHHHSNDLCDLLPEAAYPLERVL